jgi:formate/nitrite transporter FocA (FNT family)
MTISLTLACIWVVAAAIVAFLPMRLQYAPGLTLLLLAVPLLVFIGFQHSFWVVLLAVGGLVSMFRRPLWFLGRRLLGRLKAGGT